MKKLFFFSIFILPVFLLTSCCNHCLRTNPIKPKDLYYQDYYSSDGYSD